MKRAVAAALALALAAGGKTVWAGFGVSQVAPLALAGLGGAGQVGDPRISPDGAHLSFELLGADGETLQVYLAPLAHSAGRPPEAGAPELAVPQPPADPFRLPGPGSRPVSEHLSWGPPKRGQPRYALAATRVAASRGAAHVNFDLYFAEPGRRRYLTDHPATDAQPAVSPDGDFIAFASGRSGQGDVYLYHFFAEAEPYVAVSFEAAGSELYPAWDPAGERLAYTGQLGAEYRIFVVDQVRTLAAEPDPERRKTAARRLTRDLTPGWKGACLAPSFSPDGQRVAFYSRDGASGRADLYVVGTEGGAARLLLRGGLPETRGGPRWSPRGDGLFTVREDADRLNPLVWVPLAEAAAPSELDTGTQLNADPFAVAQGDAVRLYFTAQGGGDAGEKRWRRIYSALLTSPGETP